MDGHRSKRRGRQSRLCPVGAVGSSRIASLVVAVSSRLRCARRGASRAGQLGSHGRFGRRESRLCLERQSRRVRRESLVESRRGPARQSWLGPKRLGPRGASLLGVAAKVYRGVAGRGKEWLGSRGSARRLLAAIVMAVSGLAGQPGRGRASNGWSCRGAAVEESPGGERLVSVSRGFSRIGSPGRVSRGMSSRGWASLGSRGPTRSG